MGVVTNFHTSLDAARLRSAEKDALHSIWREAADKGIEHGIDWPRVVLDLFKSLDRAEAAIAAASALADEWQANYEKWANVGPEAPKVAILRVHANRLRSALRTHAPSNGEGPADV